MKNLILHTWSKFFSSHVKYPTRHASVDKAKPGLSEGQLNFSVLTTNNYL